MDKLVSIIIPVYGVEKYVERCLVSAIKQTYKNIEIIVVNDASVDNSLAIAEKYANIDSRIKIINKPNNEGLLKARIDGIKESQGEYIMHLDGDDYLSTDFVRLLVNKAEENGADLVAGKIVIVGRDGSKSIFSLQDQEMHKLPLYGENIRNHFFAQAGTSYSWHVVWNKLYSRELIEKAFPYFENISEHILMTEDILQSAIIMFFAECMYYEDEALCFYCENAGSATDNRKMSIESFEKKFSDVTYVFNAVRDFLLIVKAPAHIMEGYSKFRKLYSRIWERGISQIEEVSDRETALEMVEAFETNRGDETSRQDNYFLTVRIPFDDTIERIKEAIVEAKVVSFDIFDTAILRPFVEPTDLFILLDAEYEKNHNSYTSFSSIRKRAEKGVRLEKNREKETSKDITIADIYEYIHRYYGIPETECNSLMAKEKELEIELSAPRYSAKSLFEFAKYLKKEIIFISDMYLDKDTIAAMLEKCGYRGHSSIYLSSESGCLKYNGELFSYVIEQKGIRPEDVLHIGDNRQSDVEQAQRFRIRTFYFPKAYDLFMNSVDKHPTNGCYHNNDLVSPPISYKENSKKSLGVKSMFAICANKYFDNPYRYFHPQSDYNIDSYFIGYYCVGMYLIGICEQIIETATEKHSNRVVFTARDGYLMKKAFDIFSNARRCSIPSYYLYVSRRALLPWIISEREDFFHPPIVVERYSRKRLVELLDYCIDSKKIMSAKDLITDDKFTNEDEFVKFVSLLLDEFYDSTKHQQEKQLIRTFLSDSLLENDLVFDTGYSASIHRVLVEASEKELHAFFIHSDDEKNFFMSRRGGFDITDYYGTFPAISGLIREHLLSDLAGSCIAYRCKEGKVVPVFEDVEKSYTDCFPIGELHRGAIDFVKDYCKLLEKTVDLLLIKPRETIAPFEAFLNMSKNIDRKMFSASFFEDRVYGANDRLSVEEFWRQTIIRNIDAHNSSTKMNLKELILRGNSRESKLAFWGTGKICRELCDIYGTKGIDFFIDNTKKTEKSEMNGVPILHPTDILDWSSIFIVISCASFAEIKDQLKSYGLVEYENFVSYFEVL